MELPGPLTNLLAMRLGPLEFGDPVWLFALLLLVPVLYLWKTSRVPGSPVRRWGMLALRVALILAIVFSLADTRMVWFNKGICVAFVLDQSQSVPGDARENVRGAIDQEIQKMSRDDQFVVVEFGGDAVLGALPSPRGNLPPPVKVADTGHTDIARALRVAMASFPADKQKRIVLFSDGNQNEEDALREARIAGVKDVDIQVLPMLEKHGHEVMVDQVVIPPHVRKDARFLVRALVTSDTAQNVELIVSRDGAVYKHIDSQHLNAGSNVIDVPDMLSDGGAHQYEVTIVPQNREADTFAANNTGYALTQVDAPGKVLLVRGKSSDPTFLYDALSASGIQTVKTNPGGLPGSADALAAYDCVILDNVNYFDLANSPQLPALKKWVEDFGGGLVLVGGDDSFGPGGYKDTILEELSPVEMDVKRQKHLASLAVVVMLDKSGSMGMSIDATHQKIDLADDGASQVLKLLDSRDLAMIGACDIEVHWVDNIDHVIPMTPGNKQKIISGTMTIRAGGGGIYCDTALDHSYRLVNDPNVHAMTKHVIMFADSQDSEQPDGCVEAARANFIKNGVTTSVIGMGTLSDPDVPFQKAVAEAGHGRFFITEDVRNLPRIFVKEAFLVSRQAFIEEKDGINLTPYNSPLLEGFLEGGKASLPPIYGYVGTTLKPRATLALHGKQADDPVLAHWVIGLGKCVAYTSDSNSRWGKDWVSWNGYSKFWTQIVRWVSRNTKSNGLATTTLIDGSDGRVIVDAVDTSGKPINNLQLQANVLAPDQSGGGKDVTLEQIAPGRYQGHFTASQRGTYLVAVSQGTPEAHELVATGGGVLSYPPEYRDLQPNVALLKNLADASHGLYIDGGMDVFQQKSNPVRTFWPLWQLLLVIVTGVLLADIAWRRLNVADWFRRASAGLPVLIRTDASLGALRAIKSGRQEVDSQRQTMRQRVETIAATRPIDDEPSALTTATPAQTATLPEEPHTAQEPAPTGNYADRLLSAKKRAKDQIREQSKNDKK